MDDSLYTGSDHYTIRTVIPFPTPKPPTTGRRILPEHLEIWDATVASLSSGIKIPHRLVSQRAIETLCASIMTALRQAYEVSSTPIGGGHRATPWWSPEVASARTKLAQARADGTLTLDQKREYRRLAKRVESSYWQDRIQSADNAARLFAIAKWRKPSDRLGAPPLRHNDRVYVNPREKTDLLAKHVLAARAAGDDVPDPLLEGRPAGYKLRLRINMDATEPEAGTAYCGVANTAPGGDKIGVVLLSRV